MATATHLAGCYIKIGARCLQRCMICGHVLIDHDLSRAMVPEGMDPEPGRWKTGDLVQHEETAGCTRHSLVGELPEDFKVEDLPDDFCLELVEQ